MISGFLCLIPGEGKLLNFFENWLGTHFYALTILSLIILQRKMLGKSFYVHQTVLAMVIQYWCIML